MSRESDGVRARRPGWRKRAGRVVVTTGGLVLALMVWVFFTPPPKMVIAPSPSLRISAYDGSTLAERAGSSGQRARSVTLDDVSPHLVHATLAGEDHRFRDHHGIDPLGVLRAILLDLESARFAYGGSTLTQQLARLCFPGPRTVLHKVRETFWALVLETHLSKDEILAAYLSRAPYGGNLTGVQAASESYFGKPAKALSLGEASLLAVLPRSPGRYDVRKNPQAVLARRSHVLGLMVKRGFISEEERARAEAEELVIRPPIVPMRAPHLVMRLSDAVGEVRTAIDPAVQEKVEHLVHAVVDELRPRGVTQAAALVLELPEGKVRAYVGSAGFFDDAHLGQVDGVRAKRSPGSVLKPIVYAAALDAGFTAASLLVDEMRPFAAEKGVYLPANFDRKEHGRVRVREALANSYNLAAVDLAERMGTQGVLDTLHAFGMPLAGKNADELGLGMVVGGVDVSLEEVAAAYLALARGGEFVSPVLVEGQQRERRRVVSREAAWIIGDVLRDDVARSGTFKRGSALWLPYDAAVKTGTSKDFRDNWAAGFSSKWLVATWAGDFEGRPMAGVSGVTGAGTLWHRIMRTVHAEDPPAFTRPEGIDDVTICASSGLRAGKGCARTLVEHFAKGSAPRETCDGHDGGVTTEIALVTPAVGAVYRVDPDRPESGWGLPVVARGRRGERLEVRVDGVLVASGTGAARGTWKAEPGVHQVVLTAGSSTVDGAFEVR